MKKTYKNWAQNKPNFFNSALRAGTERGFVLNSFIPEASAYSACFALLYPDRQQI